MQRTRPKAAPIVRPLGRDDAMTATPPETSPNDGPATAGPGHDVGRDAGDPVVSIIVVSYNTKEMTLECLRSIVQETPDLTYEVLFIDNQSTDGSWEAVHDEFNNDPRFTLRLSDKNLGFAGANNEMAKGARGEYILLLNPDTVVLDRAIEKLVDFAHEYPDNGIWGGRTVFADGSLNPTSCWGPYTLWWIFVGATGLWRAFPKSAALNPRSIPNWERDSIREVSIISGCFLMIARGSWEALGGFDLRFFMYGEEADLCMRGAGVLGFRPLFTPAAEIIHHQGASEGGGSRYICRLYHAEHQLFYKHWPRWKVRMAVMLWTAGTAVRATAEVILKRPPRWREVWRDRAMWQSPATPI